MSSETWQDLNGKYLATSLDWLRLRLQALLPKESEVPATTIASPASPERSRWPFGGKTTLPEIVRPTTSRPSLPGPTVLQKLIADAEEARNLAAKIDPLPALMQLAHEFQLSEFERDVVFLCSAVEFDSGIGGLVARVAESLGREHPTFGLAMSLFENPHWDALSTNRPLRNAKLIEINQPGSTPLTLSGLRADERVLAFVKGINNLDDRLNILMTDVSEQCDQTLSLSQRKVCDELLDSLHAAISESILPVVQLTGLDPETKLSIAANVCETTNSRLYRIAAEALPTQMSEIDSLAKLWQRETCLMAVALYIEAEELDSAPQEVQSALVRLVSKAIGLVFIGVRENAVKLDVASVCFQIDKPTHTEQFEAWDAALKAKDIEDPESVEQLAGQFDLSISEINQVVAQATRGKNSPPDPTVFWDLSRGFTKPRLDELASRIDTKATWDDLVLPDEQMRLMRSITGQMRERYKVYNEWGFASRMNRGFGIAALFAGASGTGKTMAAEVIANDLRLNLYRIDLSSVVSKYIGETEKNLRRLFDAAEQGGAILFFDEADALFGKRSEVKDSHDRYANIEINYLLQRMESFSGLAILATNVKSALDPAFSRRLRFIVNFPFPTSADRKRIWQQVLPAQTPQEGLDFDRLSRLNVTGANIQSIALNAAFIAASSGQSVTMPALMTAAYTEMRKLDRLISELDLR